MKKILFIVAICLICLNSVFSQSKKTWEKTQSLNSVSAYVDFIIKYPDGKYTELARQGLEELEFLNAKQQNTIKAYVDFLSTNSQSKYATEVSTKLRSLRFDFLNSNPTIAGCEEYLNKYSGGSEADSVNKLLEQLSFREAESENSSNSYKSYLSKFPNGKSAEAAKLKLQEIQLEIQLKYEKELPKTAIVVANSIFDIIIKYYKHELQPYSGLVVTRNYPLILNISKGTEGNLDLEKEIGNIRVTGKLSITPTSDFDIAIMNEKTMQVAGSSSGGLTTLDLGTSNANNSEWVTLVGAIKSGSFDCSGYFYRDGMSFYFESGKITFTDNKGLCSFSEGSTIIFTSKKFLYTNGIWVKQ
jgi:outer membrane protein assembly factor BamD (BamD/ComL family)